MMFFYYFGVILGVMNFKLTIDKRIIIKRSIPLQIYGFCLIVLFFLMAPFAIQGFQSLMKNAFKSANHTILELIMNGRVGIQLLVMSHFYVKIIIKKKTYEDLINKLSGIHNEIVVNYQRKIAFPASCERIFYLIILKVIILEMLVPYLYIPYVIRIGNWEQENMLLYYMFMGLLFTGFNFVANLYYIGVLYLSHVFEILNLQLLVVLRKAELLNTNLTELLECSDEIDKLANIYGKISDFLRRFLEFLGFSSTFTLINNFLTCVGQVISHIMVKKTNCLNNFQILQSYLFFSFLASKSWDDMNAVEICLIMPINIGFYFSLQFLHIYAAEVLLAKIQNTKIMLNSISKIPKDIRLHKSVRKYVNKCMFYIFCFMLFNSKIEEFSLQLAQYNMKVKAWNGLFMFDYNCLFDVSIHMIINMFYLSY